MHILVASLILPYILRKASSRSQNSLSDACTAPHLVSQGPFSISNKATSKQIPILGKLCSMSSLPHRDVLALSPRPEVRPNGILPPYYSLPRVSPQQPPAEPLSELQQALLGSRPPHAHHFEPHSACNRRASFLKATSGYWQKMLQGLKDLQEDWIQGDQRRSKDALDKLSWQEDRSFLPVCLSTAL